MLRDVPRTATVRANELVELLRTADGPVLLEDPSYGIVAGKDTTAEEYLDQIAKKHAPIGRFASPEELARFFVFLCSPCASYSVGSTYYVDGGWLGSVG